MTDWQHIDAEGRYCLNPECGADSDHLSVEQNFTTDEVRVSCFACGYVGKQ